MNQLEEVAVVIPIYQDLFRKSTNRNILFQYISVLNNCRVLFKRKIFIIAPRLSCEKFRIISELQTTFDNLELVCFDDIFFASINGYNKLMMSMDFYLFFVNFKYIYICQTDVWVFKDNLSDFTNLNYSYIGGICFGEFERENFDRITILDSVGALNGGSSLRKVEDFIAVLSSNFHWYSRNELLKRMRKLLIRLKLVRAFKLFMNNKLQKFIPAYAKNEDGFFYLLSKKTTDFKVPNFLEVLNFSTDGLPWIVVNELKDTPMACHAWFKNDYPYPGNYIFWANYIKLDELDTLQLLKSNKK